MNKQKIDITISRGATISLPNYRGIKPAVSITVKNIDVDKTTEVYDKVSHGLDALWGLECLSLMNELDALQQRGPVAYIEALRNAESRMMEVLERFGNEMVSMTVTPTEGISLNDRR